MDKAAKDAHVRDGDDGHAHGGHDHAHEHPHGNAHDEHDHGHGHDHGHDHPHDHPRDERADGGHAHARGDAAAASKLPYVLALTLTFFGVEMAAASYAHSNALRADAIHLLADVAAIGIAYSAFRLADRRPSARFTFGLRRIEAVAALVNAVLVMLGAAEIVHEGIEALGSTTTPRTGIMLGIAASALVVHGLNATLLHRDLHGHGHVHESPHLHVGQRPKALHVHGAWLHVVGDALGALVALIAAAAIRFGAPPSVDPIASFFVAALLVVGALKLIRDAGVVLLEAAPAHLPVEAIEKVAAAVPGVDCVHRLRVWTLGTGYDALTVHVRARPGFGLTLASSVETALTKSFHLDYVCVQVDPPRGGDT